MADLAKVEKPVGARRRGSDNRDFTLPSRRETDTPRLEVNAPIAGKSQSEAQRLAEILGVAEDAANAALPLLDQRDARRRDEARTAGSMDSATGHADEDRLAKSRAYAQGFYTSGAQRTVLELRTKALDAVNERLFNEDDPATLDDVNETLNGLFASVALNEDGTPRNFGDPSAARIMAEGLAKIRNEVLPQAAEHIRKQQNEKLASNVAFNLVNGGMPELYQPGATGVLGLRVPQPGDVRTIDVPPSAAAPADLANPAAPPPSAASGLVAPFAGFKGAAPTDRIGSPRPGGRTHNGEDFAVPSGTPLVAPAAGRVVSTSPSSAGGKQVIVELANGDRVGFAHLSSVSVKPGDQISAGQALGATGKSGNATGPSVHMTVTVGGKKVSPSEYFSGKVQEVAETRAGANEDPNLRDRVFKPGEEPTPPAVDFEKVMAQRPPSISPAEWKGYMVPAIIEHAEIAKQPELLEGLWRSTRKDGTPSFNPQEIDHIRDAAERIRTQRREEANRVQRETFEKNADVVIGEILNGRDPSDATLVDMANRHEIDTQFAYSVIEHREAEARQAEREVTADAKEAQREADREFDLEAATVQMEREAGLLDGSSLDEDMARLKRGEFGTGKAGLRRYRQIRASTAQAIKRLEESPTGQFYATQLDEAFPKVSKGDGSMLSRAVGPQSNSRRAVALAHYSQLLAEGKQPREAYEATMKLYGGQGGDATLQARMRELQSKK